MYFTFRFIANVIASMPMILPHTH